MKRLLPWLSPWLSPWLLLVLIGLAAPAHAVEPGERLANPALEARARAISAGLRCLVCQNESIDDSNADLAHDIRMLVRQRLVEGDTDAQVVQAVVNRYGQFVLLKPPVEPATYLLWFGPPAVLAIGLAGSLLWIVRRRRRAGELVPALSADERRDLDTLLRESGG
ncbi:MAG TPA: cytochrome c-type biogenesis protein [Rhodopila sp.]|uniref:cytochrome c-type biogenesis protein n=1 Tax=Rhodopila sp. TaxID=2480087 RepID=UPI002C1BA133|nr:cytochrome c-type biogenesis protein [Rhodopila sp.]HVY14361.1 cytochrome c-type biogenesis protein [Rhodopila sp.]